MICIPCGTEHGFDPSYVVENSRFVFLGEEAVWDSVVVRVAWYVCTSDT